MACSLGSLVAKLVKIVQRSEKYNLSSYQGDEAICEVVVITEFRVFKPQNLYSPVEFLQPI